ncbi:MAG: hypothetical protein ACI9MR_004119 [Myxococcota bacterium]
MLALVPALIFREGLGASEIFRHEIFFTGAYFVSVIPTLFIVAFARVGAEAMDGGCMWIINLAVRVSLGALPIVHWIDVLPQRRGGTPLELPGACGSSSRSGWRS